MEFKDNVSVYTSDGNKAGSLQRVVIDPETNEITHIVIQKGFLFKEDKVVAVEEVASTSEEKVTLNCTTDKLQEMPPLDIEQFEPLSGASGRGQNFDPLAGGLYWNPAPERSVITVTKRTIPDDLVALKEGAPVMSKDDEHVGSVERVFTEPENGKVSHFIVSQGLLLKTRKAIPIQWVKALDDEQVHLTVLAQELEDLPEIQD